MNFDEVDQLALVAAIGVGMGFAWVAASRNQNGSTNQNDEEENNVLAISGLVGFVAGFVVYVLFEIIFVGFVAMCLYLLVMRFGASIIRIGREGTSGIREEVDKITHKDVQKLEPPDENYEEIEQKIKEARNSGESPEAIEEEIRFWEGKRNGR